MTSRVGTAGCRRAARMMVSEYSFTTLTNVPQGACRKVPGLRLARGAWLATCARCLACDLREVPGLRLARGAWLATCARCLACDLKAWAALVLSKLCCVAQVAS